MWKAYWKICFGGKKISSFPKSNIIKTKRLIMQVFTSKWVLLLCLCQKNLANQVSPSVAVKYCSWLMGPIVMPDSINEKLQQIFLSYLACWLGRTWGRSGCKCQPPTGCPGTSRVHHLHVLQYAFVLTPIINGPKVMVFLKQPFLVPGSIRKVLVVTQGNRYLRTFRPQEGFSVVPLWKKCCWAGIRFPNALLNGLHS